VFWKLRGYFSNFRGLWIFWVIFLGLNGILVIL
jgi:hypothetical protein